jgi:hypothetical protein
MAMPHKNDNGEWVVDQSAANVLRDELLDSWPCSKEYKKCYVEGEWMNHLGQILGAADVIYPGREINLSILATCLTQLMLSGDIAKRPEFRTVTVEKEPEPVVDTRPRAANGQFLTPAQVVEKEYRDFYEASSASEIRQRASREVKFAEWFQKELRGNFQGVGDAVTPTGAPRETRTASQVLVDFADAYLHEPVENLRARGGFVTLKGDKVPVATFNELVDASTNAGLI